jgi:hypothetical protein
MKYFPPKEGRREGGRKGGREKEENMPKFFKVKIMQ